MHNNFLIAATIFIVSVACGFSNQARAEIGGIGDSLGLSPYWNWKTIESEHFRVTFPADLSNTAEKATQYLEEAHRLLSPILYWQASYRVPILVIDNSDESNGMTTAFLRFGIVLVTTPPENWFSTTYYDDWLRLLAIHEYTHFLNMDATRGFWSIARVLFGDIIVPNCLWPTWMLEGLAVYMETRFTHAGRGRSPYYEMILRTAVQEGVLGSGSYITLDRVNGPNPYYPGGETAYTYGYQMMNEVARTNNEDVLGIMSKTSSDRFPFFIDGNLENLTGLSWGDQWNAWLKTTKTRALKEIDQIQSQPLSKIETLTDGGFDTLGPVISPDGHWLAYTQDSLDPRMGLFLRDLKTGKTRRIDDKLNGAQMAFTPDSSALLLSGLQRTGNYYLYSELAVYDMNRDSLDWLTSGARARDPELSPDGKSVVFTITEDQTTGLATAPLIAPTATDKHYHLGTISKVFMPEKYGRISNPKFRPEPGDQNRHIVCSFHRNATVGEEIVEIDRVAGTVKSLVTDGHLNRYPTFSPNHSLYFLSGWHITFGNTARARKIKG